jgi:hypothetical protein
LNYENELFKSVIVKTERVSDSSFLFLEFLLLRFDLLNTEYPCSLTIILMHDLVCWEFFYGFFWLVCLSFLIINYLNYENELFKSVIVKTEE